MTKALLMGLLAFFQLCAGGQAIGAAIVVGT